MECFRWKGMGDKACVTALLHIGLLEGDCPGNRAVPFISTNRGDPYQMKGRV